MTRLVTVMYHYVRDVETTPYPNIKGVSVDDFARQVDMVRASFETPPLEACLEFLDGRWDPGRDLCILTFDDGLIDHYETAAPILTEAGVPAAFFLPTAALEDHEVLAVHMNHFLLAWLGTAELRRLVDDAAGALHVALPEDPTPEQVAATYRWDDAETARLKYLMNHQLSPDVSERILAHVFPDALGPVDEFARQLYVDWGQAASLQEAGFHVGGHTHRHKVLAGMSNDQQRRDLAHSRDLIERHLGPAPRGFAYPYGKPSTYTDSTIAYLKELGYTCGFTTTVDDGRAGTPRWEIPRIDPKDL